MEAGSKRSIFRNLRSCHYQNYGIVYLSGAKMGTMIRIRPARDISILSNADNLYMIIK